MFAVVVWLAILLLFLLNLFAFDHKALLVDDGDKNTPTSTRMTTTNNYIATTIMMTDDTNNRNNRNNHGKEDMMTTTIKSKTTTRATTRATTMMSFPQKFLLLLVVLSAVFLVSIPLATTMTTTTTNAVNPIFVTGFNLLSSSRPKHRLLYTVTSLSNGNNRDAANEFATTTSTALKSFSFIDALISKDEDDEVEQQNTNKSNNERSMTREAVDTTTAFPVPDQAYSASTPFPQQQMMAPLPQDQKKQNQQRWVERFYEKRGPPPPAPMARPPLVRPQTLEEKERLPPQPQVRTQQQPQARAQSSGMLVRQQPQQEPDLRTENLAEVKNVWDSSAPVTVQGGQSLRTWALKSSKQHPMSAVQVLLRTEGRPLNANVDLWHGPDNTPFKLSIYVEDGNERPFSAIIPTPHSSLGNTVAVRNTAETMEFPIQACVQADFSGDSGIHAQGQTTHIPEMQQYSHNPNNSNSNSNYNNMNNPFMTLSTLPRELWERTTNPKTLQGNGAVYVQTYGPEVDQVEILLTTEMRPLHARIEVLQGPNNIKQIMEVVSEDGQSRPFYCVVETPGSGNVIRIVNTADLEFPMDVRMGPFYGDLEVDGYDDDGYFYDENDENDDDDDVLPDDNFQRFSLPPSSSSSSSQGGQQTQQRYGDSAGYYPASNDLADWSSSSSSRPPPPSSPFLSP